MRKGSQLKINAPSKKGNQTVDTYSLTGFSQAIDRALKDCPGELKRGADGGGRTRTALWAERF